MMAPSEELRRPDKPDKLRPEAGVLKPLKLEIGMAMLVLYISLPIRTTLRLFRLGTGSVFLPLHWVVYHLTEPLMSVVREAFPKMDSFMATLLPLLAALTLYGADILVNLQAAGQTANRLIESD